MENIYNQGKTSLKSILLATTLFTLFFNAANAQTFVQRNVAGSATTSAQLSSTTAKRVQSIYTPFELGNPVKSGFVDTIYFKRSSTSSGQNHTDFEIYLGQTTDTVLTTNMDNNATNANLVKVFGAGALSIPTGGTAGDWVAIPLDNINFKYDSSLSLVVETRFTTNGSSLSWLVQTGTHDPTNTNKKVIANNPTASTGAFNVQRANFAFFAQPVNVDDAAVMSVYGINSPAVPANHSAQVTIRNYGTDTLKNVLIGWDVNGVVQTPFAWSGSLARSESEANITISSFNFTDYNSTITAWVYAPNGNTDGNNSNDTSSLSIKVCNPLVGNYTIDQTQATAGNNFASFNEIADRLNNCGISGHVNISVAAGTGPYLEQVIFNNIQGSDDTARIYLNGNGEVIKLGVPILSNVPTSNPNRHIVRLADVKYFTLDNLKVELDSGSTAFMGVHLFNTASYVTVKNCTIDMKGTTSTLIGGVILSGSQSSILTSGNYDSVLIDANTTIAGGYGTSVYGLASPLSKRIVILNNTFYDFNDNGVYLRETDGTVVINNTINRRNGNVGGLAQGIQVAQTANINARIIGNYISTELKTANNFRGVYIYGGAGHQAYNNVFYNFQNTTGNEVTAFKVRGGAPEIYFNTIVFNSTDTSTGKLSALVEELGNTNFVFKNNMVSITQPCDSIRVFVVPNSTNLTSSFSSENNIYNVPNGRLAQRTGTFYNTLADWQAATFQDGSSYEFDPLYATATLPFVPTNPSVNNLGTPIAGITTDVLDNTRSATFPDAGAYEFSPCVDPAQPTAISGDTLVCKGSTKTYIVPALGSELYFWNVPADANITSGQSSSTITVEFGTLSGEVTVVAQDTCGTSDTTRLAIVVQDSLAAPAAIFGDTTLCANENGVAYSVAAIANADSYNWTVTGTTLVSGQGTNAIEVDFASTSATIAVAASNDVCGSSATSTVQVLVSTAPPTPGLIAGDTSLCVGVAGVAFEIDSVAGADNYVWTVTNGTLVSGQSSKLVSVDFASAAVATVSVAASNACGQSDSSVLQVAVHALPVVTFTLPTDQYCSTGAAFSLTGGSPTGGVYSGTAVLANDTFVPATAGVGKYEITYTYTDNNGCEATATDSITVNVCSGIEDVSELLGKVTVSPNPFSLFTIVEFEKTPETIVNVTLADAEGRIVRNFVTTDKSFLVERNSLSTGMYYLILKSNNIVFERKRIVVQ